MKGWEKIQIKEKANETIQKSSFIPLTFFLNISAIEQAFMIAVCLFAIIVELFNSAIEAVVDRISLEQHELSKNAKDMGSAAQFIALFIIFITWCIILFL